MTPNLSGGAPLFIMCLCLQSRESVMSIDIVEYTLSKNIFSLPMRHSLVLQSNILDLDIYTELIAPSVNTKQQNKQMFFIQKSVQPMWLYNENQL